MLNAPIEVGYNTALACHMGNMAYKTGNRIYWDANKKAFDDSKSNALMTPVYHNGWKLPDV